MPSADTDKNEAISALEAFQYADRKTAAFTNRRSAWRPSTPCSRTPARRKRCARLRRTMARAAGREFSRLLRIGAAQKAANDPAKRALLAKKEELERKIDTLKYQKAAMSADDYKKQLTDALLELAKVQEDLDK
jgi:hypothetical protein